MLKVCDRTYSIAIINGSSSSGLQGGIGSHLISRERAELEGIQRQGRRLIKILGKIHMKRD